MVTESWFLLKYCTMWKGFILCIKNPVHIVSFDIFAYDLVVHLMFGISWQACIGSKVIASEALSAIRKDVLAKCYGKYFMGTFLGEFERCFMNINFPQKK